MKINPDVINSLNENLIEVGDCWLFADSDIYSEGFREILSQPISTDTITLNYISVKDPITTITIRSGYTSASPLIYNAVSYNVNEFEDTKSHNELQGLQGGLSGNFYHVSENTYRYTSSVISNVQDQINSKCDFSVISAGLQEPLGFPTSNNTSLSFNNSTRTFTISALDETFDVYYRGTKFEKATQSIQIPNLSGAHFIYYTSAGTLTTSQTPWDILTTIQIAYVYWNGTSAIIFADERHGTIMDGMSHKYHHFADGTRYINGFNATYTIQNASSAQFGIAEGIIADEDIFINILNGLSGNYYTQQINFPAYIPVYYREGVDGNGTWKKDIATNYPYKQTGTGYANFNILDAGVWKQQALTNGNYGAYFIYATNNMSEPIISIQSQRDDANFVDAQTYNTPAALVFADFPAVEAKLLYRIIIRAGASYTQNPFKIRIEEVADYRSETAILNAAAGGTGTVTSVALSVPSDFVVAGSPITNAGTLAVTYATQTSGTFLAGPISGSSTTPTFRKIVSADLPMLSAYTLTTTTSAISANLQSQITNNNNKLSGYLPLSGGTLTGQLNAKYISADGGFLVRRDSQDTIQIYRPTSGVTTTFGQTFEANNNVGQKVVYSKILNSIDSAVSGLHSGSIYFKIYKNGAEQTPVQILDTQLKVFGTISASGNITSPQFNGNLNGYKNVDNANESTIANGFASGNTLYINYRGATSSINEYRFCNGLGAVYSGILASAFIKNGGLPAQFLKADGSVDSNVYITSTSLTPYTLITTTSAISANLQSQITNNNNKLSGYLPLSGGTLTGQLLIKSQLSASGDLIGARHIITGGLSTQFLKADGSIDSNSYALDTLGDYYLPLSGGTLAGDIVSQNIRPTAPFFQDLGSVFFPYASLYVSAINANKINMEGSIIPTNSLLYDLGSNSNKWNKIYTKDITSVAMSTVFDRAVEAVNIKSHILLGFGNQLAPHLNFSSSLGTSANLSGDFYFDGLNLKIRDKNSVLKTLSYTSDLSAYTPTSGFDQTISEYLPLSGGTLTGLLKGTNVSASGNISATNFVGNLEGYKNVDSGNEATISNGFAHSSGELYVNYRGAISAINNYNFCNGKGSTLSTIKAAGATLTGNLKISAVSEGWSEGIKVMVPVNNWGGFRLTRSSSLAGTEDNWSIGYRADSTGDLLFGNYTGGSDKEHTIFYKNGNVYHSGNVSATGGNFSNDLRLTKAGNNGQIYFGTGTAGISYNGGLTQFILSGGDFVPYNDIGDSLGASNFRWKNIYSQNFYGNLLGNVSGNISGNVISNSSMIVTNAAGTIDKTKIYENQVLLRDEDAKPFAGISGSYLSTSGAFCNIFNTSPSTTTILKTECALLTSGFGVNGKTNYLKSIPNVNSADSITNQTIAIRNILEAYGLITVS